MPTVETPTWLGIGLAEPPPARRLRAGETLFRRDDKVLSMHVVEQGAIRLERHLPDGTRVAAQTARAGEAVAEASLFAPRYHCDARAAADCVVRVFPKAALLARLAAEPALALGLAAHLARQVRDLRERAETREIRSASDRVLLWLRDRSGEGADVEPPAGGWTAAAEEIGLRRETLYRTLARLEKDGAIERRAKTVRLTAPA